MGKVQAGFDLAPSCSLEHSPHIHGKAQHNGSIVRKLLDLPDSDTSDERALAIAVTLELLSLNLAQM